MPSKIAKQTIAAGVASLSYRSPAASSAGMMSEKKDAASITPAANPNDRSRVARDGVRPKSTGTAPTAVIAPAARLPRNPSIKGDIVSKGESFLNICYVQPSTT